MNNKHKMFLAVSAVVLIGILAGGFWYFSRQKTSNTAPSFINYKDPKLTDGEKKIFEDRIAGLEKNLNETQDNDNKFRYSMQLGFQYYGLGEYAKARDWYSRASGLMPDNPTSFAELFVAENAMTDFQNAKKHIQRAIELNPSSAQYWRWLIQLRAEGFKDSADELDKYYKDALEKTRSNADILSIYAQFLEQKGDLQDAVAQWKKAIEVNPEQKNLYVSEIIRIQNKLK